MQNIKIFLSKYNYNTINKIEKFLILIFINEKIFLVKQNNNSVYLILYARKDVNNIILMIRMK